MIAKYILIAVFVIVLALAGCSPVNTESIEETVPSTTTNDLEVDNDETNVETSLDLETYLLNGIVEKDEEGNYIYSLIGKTTLQSHILFKNNLYGPYNFIDSSLTKIHDSSLYYPAQEEGSYGIFKDGLLVEELDFRVSDLEINRDSSLSYVLVDEDNKPLTAVIGGNSRELSGASASLHRGQDEISLLTTDGNIQALYSSELDIIYTCPQNFRLIEANSYTGFFCSNLEEREIRQFYNNEEVADSFIVYIDKDGTPVFQTISVDEGTTLSKDNQNIYSTPYIVESVIHIEPVVLTLERNDDVGIMRTSSGNEILNTGFQEVPKVTPNEDIIYTVSEFKDGGNVDLKFMINEEEQYTKTAAPSTRLSEIITYDFDRESNIYYLTYESEPQEYVVYKNNEVFLNSSDVLRIVFSDDEEFIIYNFENSTLMPIEK